jgi:uncharacterized Fe-S cluster protein YjdI
MKRGISVNEMKEKMKNQGYKAYENDEIVVFWNAEICAHAGKCIQGNSEVFKVDRRPWIMLDHASSQDIAAVIDTCPSQALRYIQKNNESEEN